MSLKSIKNAIAKHNYFYAWPFIGYPFNKTVRAQNADYKTIPIIIISFNQLFYLKQLVDSLQSRGYHNIVIVDNHSDYPPLLDYFDSIEDSVKIYRLQKNLGHRVFWKVPEIYEQYRGGYFAVTDPDVVPREDCPDDFMLQFKKILDRNLLIKKVGFSLELDDIPESHPHKQTIVEWEMQFWKNKDKEGNYKAIIDTTFALYRPEKGFFKWTAFFRGIRTQRPYTAKHGGWYLDPKNLTDEQRYYFSKANSSSTWRFIEGGELACEMYVRETK